MKSIYEQISGKNCRHHGRRERHRFDALGRIGQPEEVASAVVSLASDESSFVNDSELFTDGGMNQD